MDYLRNHHQKDHEKMQMVALKFGMFNDLAKTKEEQAKRELKKIKSKQIGVDVNHDLCFYLTVIHHSF